MDKILPHTPEWHAARLGKITGSRISRVMGGPQAQKTFLYELVEELINGHEKEFQSHAMREGIEYEHVAIAAYEFDRNVKVSPSYYVEVDEYTGCTPDGFVDNEGIIEVKCPFRASNHIDYSENGMPKKFKPQVQFNIHATKSRWCDFISYSPYVREDRSLYIQRIEYDEEYISEMVERIEAFKLKLQGHGDKYVDK